MQTVSLGSNATAHSVGVIPKFSAQRLHRQTPAPKADAVHLSRVAFGSASPEDTATSASGATSQPKRTRMTVFKDMMKRYFQKGIWPSFGTGAVIGGLIALGTPVFVVTFPATMAVLMTIALVSRVSLALRNDPNGEQINKIYKHWDEVDKAGGMFKYIQAKVQENANAQLA